MTKSFFRTLFASLATVTLFFAATPASAATITFSDNNCASFSITGNAASGFTLTCGSLACTLSASNPTPAPGVGVSLTPSCTGGTGTITYSNWISVTGGCPLLTTASNWASVITATAVGPCTYRVTGTDAASLSGTASVNVTWSSTGPAAPTGCTLAASPSSLAAVGNVTLTASCSGGGTATGYTWAGAGVVTPTAANSQVVSVAATATFSVIPSNSGVNGNMATATVTVGGGGGGALPTTCNIGGTTLKVLDLNAQNQVATVPFSTRLASSGFNGGSVLIATLVPPAGFSTNTNTIDAYEFGDASTSRLAWLSKSPCDTSGAAASTAGTSVHFKYSIGGSDPTAVNMHVGEKWYLMVVNQAPWTGANSCKSGTCNMAIEWGRPN